MVGEVFRVPYTAGKGRNVTGRTNEPADFPAPVLNGHKKNIELEHLPVKTEEKYKLSPNGNDTLLNGNTKKPCPVTKLVKKAVEKVSGNNHLKEHTLEHILIPPPLTMADAVALAVHYANLEVPLNGNGKKTLAVVGQLSDIDYIKAKIARITNEQASSFAASVESDARASSSELSALRREFKKRLAALEAEKPVPAKPMQTIVDYVKKNGVKGALLASGAAVAILSKWIGGILDKAADFMRIPRLADVPMELVGAVLGGAALLAAAIQYTIAKISQKRAPSKAKQQHDEEKTMLVRRYEDARTKILNRLELAYYYRIIDHEEYWPVLRSAYLECYAVLASEHSSEAAKDWLKEHKMPSENILNKNGTYVFGEDKPNPLPYADVQPPV